MTNARSPKIGDGPTQEQVIPPNQSPRVHAKVKRGTVRARMNHRKR